MLRRLRALLVTALLWAFAWAIVSVVPALITWALYFRFGTPTFGVLWRLAAQYAIILGMTGGLCGVGFALLLASAERDRTIADLSVRRISAWGGLAGLVMPLVGLLGIAATIGAEGTPVLGVVVVTGASALMGAGAAAGSLVAAQKARLSGVREDPKLPTT